MYIPATFREDDPRFVESFVDAHPLATLVVSTKDEVLIDHVPFTRRDSLQNGGALIAHVAKANPLCKAIVDSVSATLVFVGGSAYVSPSWYPSKAVHHEVVPTWNYVAVHIRGTLKRVDNAQQKRQLVGALTRKMEASNQEPWSIDDAPEAYLEKMLTGIVGLVFEIDSITAKTKASQNKTTGDRQGVMQGLMSSSAQDAATVLARFLPK